MKKYFVFIYILILSVMANLSFSTGDPLTEDIFIIENNSRPKRHKPKRNEIENIINLNQHKKIIRSHESKNYGPLYVGKADMRLEKDPSGNYFDLIIRKKPFINSVLLTNYYWDISKSKVREYGLRSYKYNWVNGNEKRLFKKQFIGKKQGLYFLVDSSAEEDALFGQAFRLRIPRYVIYGYKRGNEVYGVIRVEDGVKLNVRTFARKYADYKGTFKNNPVSLVFNRQPLNIKDHPVIFKVKEILEANYLGVYIQYESKSTFFKSFLVREENEREFVEIGFSRRVGQHKRAVLLEAYYKGGVGKLMRAVVYFKRDSIPKTYYITVTDKRGAHSVGRIVVKVPAAESTRDEKPSTERPYYYEELDNLDNSEYWYNEGEF